MRNNPMMSYAELEGALRINGARIIHTLPAPGVEECFLIEGTNRVVGRHLIVRALREGLIQGCGDGLFSEDHSQTYELKP